MRKADYYDVIKNQATDLSFEELVEEYAYVSGEYAVCIRRLETLQGQMDLVRRAYTCLKSALASYRNGYSQTAENTLRQYSSLLNQVKKILY